MRRPVLIFCALVMCGVAIALTLVQGRQLASLQAQAEALRAPGTEATEPMPVVASGNPAPLTDLHTPSSELLQLRGKVGQLERRKRELAGAQQENERLRVQLATRGTNAPGAIVLPVGYMRKADARFVGFDTPENTMQTMMWAIQNRDTTTLMQAFDPAMAEQMQAAMQRRASAEDFFEDADAMPGLRVTGKETRPDGTVVLSVEIVPGEEAHLQKVRFKQFGGQWKLVSGF